MKASVSPYILLFALIAFGASLGGLSAEDEVFQKGQPPRKGEILGVADGKIKFKVGPAETSVPLDQIERINKAAPAAYEAALTAWQKNDAAATLAALKPLVASYAGLPVPWAERATALLGEVYLALNQIPDAEASFTAFQKAYPNAASLSGIGLARLAVAKKDYAAAKAKLTPIITEAKGVKVAGSGKSAMYGQAFYLMGVIKESEGTLPEALQDYLTTVTLFHEDKAAVAKAQERASALTSQNVIVP